jgi:hypothetical protein
MLATLSHSDNPVINRVKLPALKGGVLPNGSASQPGEDFFNFR